MRIKHLVYIFAVSMASACSKDGTNDTLLSDSYEVTTVAGDGTYGFSDGVAMQAKFNEPKGLSTDGAGNIYVSDPGNSRIRKITPGGVVSTIAGSGTPGFQDGSALSARFLNPGDASVDGLGNIIIADVSNRRIRKLSGNSVTTLTGSNTGALFQDGVFSVARFYHPYDIYIEKDGNMLICDMFNDRIRRINTSGTVSTVAGVSQNANEYLDGPVNIAKIYGPGGVTKDNLGNIFTVDGDGRIRKIGTDGMVSTFVNYDAIIDDAFSGGIATDNNNNLIVLGNSNLYLVNPSGIVTHLAGGKLNYGYKDGTGTTALFNHLTGIVIDSEGNIFVSDSYNNRIRKISKKK